MRYGTQYQITHFLPNVNQANRNIKLAGQATQKQVPLYPYGKIF